jgi:hypothetical protein
METLKATLLTNWNFMRLLRLGIGAWVMVQSFMLNDTLMMFFGAFFVFQSVTNTGCCGVQSCAAPMVKNDNKAAEEIEYEEIKQK